MRIDSTHLFVFPCKRDFGSDRLPLRISEFRRKPLAELEDLFLEVLQICERMGRVEPGKVAFDGTRMLQEKERLKEKSQEMRERAEATDREERGLRGENRRNELSEELSN